MHPPVSSIRQLIEQLPPSVKSTFEYLDAIQWLASLNDVPSFTDPDVQAVYDILCDSDLIGKPSDQHWEGWQAQRIVANLRQSNQSPVGWFYCNRDENVVEWLHVADNQLDVDKYKQHTVVPPFMQPLYNKEQSK